MLKKFLAVALAVCFLAATPASSSTQYGVDKNHSTVGFAIPILGGLSKVRGKFTDFDVQITYDEADITKSSVNAAVKAASIDTGIENRDKHLRTADFFDVEKYPDITFQSKRVEKKGKELIAYGTFTMHGVSKEIALPVTITGKYKNPKDADETIGFSVNLTLNRQDYGITWHHKDIPNFVGDEVQIELNLITRAMKKVST
ncbi:MAG TPA: YceI family protein [Pyrinomonadaceae bacterium]|jgi:polyisoprenoid-binding protein YceI